MKTVGYFTLKNVETYFIHFEKTMFKYYTIFYKNVLQNGVILHACVQKKFRAIPSKHWCNFKRFNTILNTVVKFCWILYAKWNIWQISFNCVFVFALATLNISSMVQCPPNWKVGCSIDGHWVNRPQHFLVITVTAPTKSHYSGFSLPPIDVE